jgi:hypothetical protein
VTFTGLTQVSDGAVVVTCIEHGQIEESTHLEVSPDAKLVIHVDLANRHPLKLSTNRIHLALIDTDTTGTEERVLGVVHRAKPVAITIVGDLMIVPSRDPSKLLVRQQ